MIVRALSHRRCRQLRWRGRGRFLLTPLSSGEGAATREANGTADKLAPRLFGLRHAGRLVAVMLLARLGAGLDADLSAAQVGKEELAPADLRPADVVVTAPRPALPCARANAHAAPGIDYACLNQALKSKGRPAPARPTAIDAAAAQANSPSRIGTFSFSATSQRQIGRAHV